MSCRGFKKKNSGDENASGAIPAFSMNSGICRNRTEVQSFSRVYVDIEALFMAFLQYVSGKI